MLYELTSYLSEFVSGFNLFKYISVRVALAFAISFSIALILGPRVINLMKRKRVVDEARNDGPQSHKKKSGTPSMGGLIILPSILISTLLFARLDHWHIWVVVIATIWMGTFGFIDDWIKFKGNKGGLIAKYKLMGQISLGLIIGLVLYFYPHLFSAQMSDMASKTTLPFLKNSFLQLAPNGFWPLFLLVVIITITGTSNSTNLVDGNDGLAIGLVGIMSIGLGALSYFTGHIEFSNYLNIPYLPGSGELAVFCGAILGASLGFLWFNCHPADIFMGDTGSLALGAAMAAVAILIRKEIFLIMLGGVMVIDTLSVIIQVRYFQYTKKRFGVGRRIFLMSPLHHHYELRGWHESKIVIRFWIVGIILLFITLTSFKVR